MIGSSYYLDGGCHFPECVKPKKKPSLNQCAWNWVYVSCIPLEMGWCNHWRSNGWFVGTFIKTHQYGYEHDLHQYFQTMMFISPAYPHWATPLRNLISSPHSGHAQCHVVRRQETGIIITATDVRNTKPHIDWQATFRVVLEVPWVMALPRNRCGAPVATKSQQVGVHITPISLWFMVRIKLELYHGVYKPSYITGGPTL